MLTTFYILALVGLLLTWMEFSRRVIRLYRTTPKVDPFTNALVFVAFVMCLLLLTGMLGGASFLLILEIVAKRV